MITISTAIDSRNSEGIDVMRYPEIFAAIDGITSPEGPFPILEQEIDGD